MLYWIFLILAVGPSEGGVKDEAQEQSPKTNNKFHPLFVITSLSP